MGLVKNLAIGGAIVGVGYLLLKSKAASAASPSASTPGNPPGWTPPAGAVLKALPPSASSLGFALQSARYPSDPGQPPGYFLIVWTPNDPSTYIALFWPNSTGPTAATPAVMAKGATPQSDALLSSLSTIIPAVVGS